MSAQNLHITLAQINPTVGDLTGNISKILNVWRAPPESTDIIIFPELALCGYPPEDLVLKPAFLDAVDAAIQGLLNKSTNFKGAALIGCPWRHEEKIYNAEHLIESGKIIATRFKHHLPNYGVFDEMRIFKPGPLPAPVDFKGAKLGIMICEDMWFSDVAAQLKHQGAEILIASNASPYDVRNKQRRYEQARARAVETRLPLLYVNQIGGQDDLVFDGGSFVMDAAGAITKQGKIFEEDIISFYPPSPSQPSAGSHPLPKGEGDPRQSRRSGEGLESEIYAALCLGLKDYVRKNGFKSVLLGLSGGIDSALTAVIAADALGPNSVHCVMLPSRFTADISLEDAQTLAQNIGCTYKTISIEEPVSAFGNLLKPHLPETAPATTFENIQPRTRGVILMALSNASSALLLTTGNKSEMAAGYATLYGDMCGGFNVLKDVYKTQVYALARWRNNRSPVIPKRILTRAPSAELKESQTDQDTLPPYDVLDDILQGLIEENLDIESIAARGHDPALIKRVWHMLDTAEYKRRQSAPGVKITPRAFGRERRYPITNRFFEQS
jgi:NAD+ synthase